MTALTPEAATRAVNRLALMAFFPADPDVRAALVDIVLEMVETQEQCDWLVSRALKLYAKWPGVAELRALYCSKWKPRDGVETYSSIYLDGIPSEHPVAHAQPGQASTADPQFEAELQRVAKLKQMPGRVKV